LPMPVCPRLPAAQSRFFRQALDHRLLEEFRRRECWGAIRERQELVTIVPRWRLLLQPAIATMFAYHEPRLEQSSAERIRVETLLRRTAVRRQERPSRVENL